MRSPARREPPASTSTRPSDCSITVTFPSGWTWNGLFRVQILTLLALPSWGPLGVVTAIAAVHLVHSDPAQKVEP